MPQESVPSEPAKALPQTNVQFDAQVPELPATISFVEGDVKVLRAEIANWEEAVAGMELKMEDMIKTGADGYTVIVFFEGSTIELEPDTEILIQEMGVVSGTGSTTIKLWQNVGTTVNRVQKLVDSESSYEVQTPSGSAVVRGSVGTVIVLPNGLTLVYNEQGEWWVYAQGQMVQIPPNWYITIVPGNVPGPLVPGQPSPPQDPNLDGWEGPVAGAPVANFTADILAGIAPLEVHFTDQSTGSITSWSWDFGDGVSSTQNPSHTYVNPGVYTVALTVSNDNGLNTLVRTEYIVVWDSWIQTTYGDFSDGATNNTTVFNVNDDGSIVLSVNGSTIVQDQAVQSYPDDFWAPIYDQNYQAQTFCAGISGSLVSIDLWLRAGGDNPPLVVELRDCDFVGGQYIPGNTVLDRTMLLGVMSDNIYNALFAPIAPLAAGEYYSIVLYELYNTGSPFGCHEWGIVWDTIQGNAFESNDAGASWEMHDMEGAVDLYFATYMAQYFIDGTYESLSFDCGENAEFGNILWEYTTLDSAIVKFQVATNNDDSTWDFVGPDGTSSTFYETGGTALWSGHNGDRYIKYKVYMEAGSYCLTPELKSVTIYYK